MLACCLLASVAAAQVLRPSAHVVRGIVFDSVTRTPLAGAIVQVTPLDSGSQPTARAYSAISNDSGAFQLTGLPEGRFSIGFQHRALGALGLESLRQVVELKADEIITVNLAIPSGPAIRARRCPGTAGTAGTGRDGLLAGFLLDAQTGQPLAGASVELQWLEIGLMRGKYTQASHRVHATIAADGAYTACGIAGGAPVGILATRSGYHDVSGEVEVPAGGTSRRDLHLVASSIKVGTATLVGRVLRADSVPLARGNASIPELGMEADVVEGRFTMAALPAGTWVAEVRGIGYSPQALMVDLTDHATTPVTILVGEKAQTLEGVRVVATTSADAKTLDALLQRRRTGGGTFFLPGSDALASASVPADVARAAAGFQYITDSHIEGRILGSRLLQRCIPTIYLDGQIFTEGLRLLNTIVPMEQVLAIAAYPDVTSIPMEWRDPRTCAVFAVWRKRP
ncbi:MAG: carboxypeptidase regulatory-like domain-containing protein [bacterium]